MFEKRGESVSIRMSKVEAGMGGEAMVLKKRKDLSFEFKIPATPKGGVGVTSIVTNLIGEEVIGWGTDPNMRRGWGEVLLTTMGSGAIRQLGEKIP